METDWTIGRLIALRSTNGPHAGEISGARERVKILSAGTNTNVA